MTNRYALAVIAVFTLATIAAAQPNSDESSFLTGTTRLTDPGRFERARAAHFSPTADWIVFHGVSAAQQPAPRSTYSVYVAKLTREENGVITGIDPPIPVFTSDEPSIRGRFHPTLPGVILLSATIDPVAMPNDSPGGDARDESSRASLPGAGPGVVTRTVPQVVRDQVTNLVLRAQLLARPDTTEPSPLWEPNGTDIEASWSPNGRFVLYTQVSQETAHGDIYIRDLASDTAIPMVTGPGHIGGAIFSPDGRRMTYHADRSGDGVLQLFTAEIRFDDRGVPTGVEREVRLTNDRSINRAATWHPSGDYVVYESSSAANPNGDLLAVSAPHAGHDRGSRPVRVTLTEDFDGLPSLSPDGSHLIWAARRGDATEQLFIANTAIGNLRATPSDAVRDKSQPAGTLGATPIAEALRAASPTARQFHAHTALLANPWLSGRFPGEPGIEIAERYIAHHLEEAGLEPAFTDRARTPRFFQPFSVSPARSPRTFIARNVGAIIPGRGELADRSIIIGAHHDHIGIGEFGSRVGTGAIHEGADDNASGVAAVLLIAEQLADHYEQLPDHADARTIVIATFSAEELGLNGARHLVNNPPVDITKTDLMINLDMVGRVHDKRISLSGLDTGDTLREIARHSIDKSTLDVETPNALTDRSDHAAFYTRQIPVLFFTISPYHDDYHTPDDEFWKLNPDDAAHVVDLATDIAARAATHPEPIRFTPIERFGETKPAVAMADVRVRFGIMPGNYNDRIPGVLVERVAPGTAAENAGVRTGDRLIAWQGRQVTSIASWMSVLARHTPGDRVTVTIDRDGDRIDLDVTLRPRD